MTQPEFDDRKDQPQYGLVVPFVCTESNGGPYADVAFAAGFSMGLLWEKLSGENLLATTELIRTECKDMADLIAMHYGLVMEVLNEDGGWLHVGFARSLVE